MTQPTIALLSALAAPLLAFAQPAPTAAPPAYVGPPDGPRAVTNRAFTGISSLAVAPNGRLWATWYAGPTPGEDHNNYVVLSTSGDGGRTWRELLAVDPDAEGPRRAFDPEVWLAPDGTLRWTWADRTMPYNNVSSDALWMLTLDDPASEASPWHPPAYVTQGVMMCKPIVLSTGEWALPVCTWYSDNSSKLVVSADRGRTWSVRGGANMPKEDRQFDEHLFVERQDGALWCLARTKSGIREAVSADRGTTWSPLLPSTIQHPSARFFITRLRSGILLLVKHGPVAVKTGRSHLTAFVSKDDGKTWLGGLLLDERAGVSYPDGQQAADGTIHITYDFDRTRARQILYATFREEDALAAKPVSSSVRLRQLISQGSGGRERAPETPRPVNSHADGAPLLKAAGGAPSSDGAEAQPFEVGAALFTDRAYACAEVPDALKGARFLRVKMDGPKTVRCARAGAVLFLTPQPERNSDSAAKALLDQGFVKVRLPEVRLFDLSNVHNYCTLYQKRCAEGEAVTFGKWAVPLFFSE